MGDLEASQEVETKLSYQVRQNGELIEVTDLNALHLITDAGRLKLCQMVQTGESRQFKYLGIGTSSELPQPSDTTLQDLVLVPFINVTIEALTVRCEFLLTRPMCNGCVIRELGLFYDDQTLFCRHIRGEQFELVKAPDIEVSGYYEIDF